MSANAIQGLIYLALTLAAGAAVWIGILHYRLSQRDRALQKTLQKSEKLQAENARLRARAAAAGTTDQELLDDVKGILR